MLALTSIYLLWGTVLALGVRRMAMRNVTEDTIRYAWYGELFAIVVFAICWPLAVVILVFLVVKDLVTKREVV